MTLKIEIFSMQSLQLCFARSQAIMDVQKYAPADIDEMSLSALITNDESGELRSLLYWNSDTLFDSTLGTWNT
jgi:hypothetical protein